MDFALIERSVAVVGGILVAFVSSYALYKDWKTPGLENHVFKLMLFLLAFGAVLATLAGLGVLGNFPKAA
ncbi:MAG: hypothetical protein ACLQPV_00075 [Vulcanimicrobiaceae bacterium]